MMLPVLFYLLSLLHPFYVSVTDVAHNSSDKMLEISIRIFTDDFENTLKGFAPGYKVDLMNPPADGVMDSLVSQYLGQKIKFSVNGEPRQMQYVGFERVEESIWTYFEILNVDELKTLAIHNPILYEYKKEQINMIHVQNGKKKQSRKLENPAADWEFRF